METKDDRDAHTRPRRSHTSNIIKELNVSKATVCRVRKRLADGDDLKNKPPLRQTGKKFDPSSQDGL
ncbi:Uncharacterized protein FKW44_021183 [Caligus rogercresseyi]|uniref:Uncharacterized protein n=1 Tax=Caligus rogercresseyi TaxID=217165 RepID=A0A7T8GR02_CALRO|nr:Uncharacterized protein FKW44_021183 [Caligus rogercresseyi]